MQIKYLKLLNVVGAQVLLISTENRHISCLGVLKNFSGIHPPM